MAKEKCGHYLLVRKLDMMKCVDCGMLWLYDPEEGHYAFVPDEQHQMQEVDPDVH